MWEEHKMEMAQGTNSWTKSFQYSQPVEATIGIMSIPRVGVEGATVDSHPSMAILHATEWMHTHSN